NRAAKGQKRGVLTLTDVNHLSNAKIFGARIADTFTGANTINVQILAGILVVAMTATTFLTQRQLMSKNMPADALSGPYANQQKMLLYVLPVVFAVGGIAFPIGVLLYWTTSNLWTMSQQFYVIRNNPSPNTEASRAKEKRDAERARKKGLPPGDTDGASNGDGSPEPPATPPKGVQRQQPKKQSRNQRRSKPKPPTSAEDDGQSGGGSDEEPDPLANGRPAAQPQRPLRAGPKRQSKAQPRSSGSKPRPKGDQK
ncbi:MAG: YidC/Oxa1 family membrane protein insertase, partial [Marmoricola sp.]